MEDYNKHAMYRYAVGLEDQEEIILEDVDDGAEQLREDWDIADVDVIKDRIQNVAVKAVIDEDGEECSVVVGIQ